MTRNVVYTLFERTRTDECDECDPPEENDDDCFPALFDTNGEEATVRALGHYYCRRAAIKAAKKRAREFAVENEDDGDSALPSSSTSRPCKVVKVDGMIHATARDTEWMCWVSEREIHADNCNESTDGEDECCPSRPAPRDHLWQGTGATISDNPFDESPNSLVYEYDDQYDDDDDGEE